MKIERILTIVGIILAIVAICFGPKIYDVVQGNVGVKVVPEKMELECGPGLIKTVTVTNHKNKPVENYIFEISWPIDKNLEISTLDLSNSMRSVISSISLQYGESNLQVYTISSIKPKASVEFDISLISDCKSEGFPIHFRESKSLEVMERIFF